MKNDIIPPVRPEQEVEKDPTLSEQSQPASAPSSDESISDVPERTSCTKKLIGRIVMIIAGLLLILTIAVAVWYAQAQRAVAPNDTTRTRVRIVPGASSAEVGQILKDSKLIRSELAFKVYVRLSGVSSKFQAGTYSVSPSESIDEVVGHLVSGRADEFTLTFYPGATLTDHTSTPEKKKTDVETVLLRAGYSKVEIETAFRQTYDHPLFASKPKTASLEGYVYGETYNFDSSATVEQILTRTFDEFYARIQENDLISGFKKQGLSLHEGIILASVIQREVPSPEDQKQVAQVFLKRFREEIELGSDITAYYGADKIGVSRSVAVDTPYNTRIHKGLPPGPIASPGLSALEAVAQPAKGNYLYFLSGDDEVTYFAHTNDEHEANIRNHCQIKCAVE